MQLRLVLPVIAVLGATLPASAQHAVHAADNPVNLVEHARQITEPFGDVARAMNGPPTLRTAAPSKGLAGDACHDCCWT